MRHSEQFSPVCDLHLVEGEFGDAFDAAGAVGVAFVVAVVEPAVGVAVVAVVGGAVDVAEGKAVAVLV